MAIVDTVFGDPCYGVRLRCLLDISDEPTQLQVLVEGSTLMELVDVAQQLMQKAPGQHTEDEWRLVQILANLSGELNIAFLLKAAYGR